MNRDAPTDVELLDMARDVLYVCNDYPLKDIIEDLTMTRSSEVTINRIFDGQFLNPLAHPEPDIRESEGMAMILSSSEDENSESDEFLRFMAGDALSRKDTVQHQDSLLPMATLTSSSSSSSHSNNNVEETSTNVDTDTILNSQGSGDVLLEEEPAIVDLHTTPMRSTLHSQGKFQPVSSLNQDTFANWDFELISVQLHGHNSPTVIFSPPRYSPGSNNNMSSPCPTSPISLSLRNDSNPFNGLPTWANPVEDSVPAILQISKAFSEATPPKITHSSSPLPKLLTYSRNGSPTETDTLARSMTSSDPNRDDRNRPEQPPFSWLGSTMYRTEILDMDKDWDDQLIDLGPSTRKTQIPDDSIKDTVMSSVDSEYQSDHNTTKSGRSRTRSATARGRQPKGKHAIDIVSTDLPLLDGDFSTISLAKDDQGYDELPSLEEEIIGRARRRRKRARTDEIISDREDEDEHSTEAIPAPSKAELKAAAKEMKRLAREAERAAKKAAREEEQQKKRELKEEEQQRKRGLKEEEQQRKRELKEKDRSSKEEEAEAEKRVARELRIANRLTAKTEGTKDMILHIEESLYRSTFGLVLQDYLASIDCQVSVMRMMESSESSAKNGHGVDMNSTDDSCLLRDMMFWCRIIRHRYDEDQDPFIPITEKEVELEAFSLIYITARTLANMIQQDNLKSRLATLKRDMRLRKNKERLKMSSKPQHNAMQLKEDRGLRQRVIFLIVGLETLFRELKKVTTRKFQQAVLASMNHEPTQDNTLRATDVEGELTVDQVRIEQEMLWLQLEQDCLIIHSNDDEESAQAVISLTEQIGLRPFKESRKTGLNVCVESIKSGTDAKDTWIKCLQEIQKVTLIVAKSIEQEYPSLRSLYEGYRECSNVYEAQLMLEDVPIIGRRSTLAPSMAFSVGKASLPAGRALLRSNHIQGPGHYTRHMLIVSRFATTSRLHNHASPHESSKDMDPKERKELPLSPYGGRFGVPEQPKSTRSIASALENVKRSPFARAKEGMKSKVNHWTDKEKNLEKRKELLHDFQSGYFAEFSELSKTGSKLWKGTANMIAADKALYMPNIVGTSLKTSEPIELVDLLRGKISLVCISGTRFGEEQIETFTTPFSKKWPSGQVGSKVQFVELNIQENPLKAGLVRMMVPFVKKSIPEERHTNYILHYKPIKHLKDPLSMQNSYLGYVFLVDSNCKIRWGAHGRGTDTEIKTLLDSVQWLCERREGHKAQ
ncbi:Mitochondrial ATPase complex subunit atp10 [Modicella reniformis]|uniref:Mitochondrial ATPase complex subunit atp10 n=1 Tax=Modicella reniformis TaxID=1440133 RepID=A0A9P6IMY7_9FUNG|nr:Mitochondrial ATPase complex subunit atp10 [Modicella reniformis]